MIVPGFVRSQPVSTQADPLCDLLSARLGADEAAPDPDIQPTYETNPPSRDFRDRGQALADGPDAIRPWLGAKPRADRFRPIPWITGSRVGGSITSQKPRPENLSHFLRGCPQRGGPFLSLTPRQAA
jgi:hypothetical protein